MKSLGRRSVRLHFSHSARLRILPFSRRVFIFISPPQEQKKRCVELDVREFFDTCAMMTPSPFAKIAEGAFFRQ